MKRPWQIWLALACCSALVAAAMAWLTHHALVADRERTAARAEADLEQRVSLALWRMDTKLAPLIAEESARPHFYYTPFITVEAPRSKAGPALEQAPSPLLLGNEGVLLNFNGSLTGEWSSPQAPPPEQTVLACANGMTLEQLDVNRRRLAELSSQITVEKLLRLLPVQPLPELSGAVVDEIASQRAVGDLGTEGGRGAPAQYGQPFYDNQLAGASPAGPAADRVGDEAGTLLQNEPQSGASNAGGRGGPEAADPPVQVQANAQAGQFGSRGQNADLDDRNTRFQQQVEQEYVKQRRGAAYSRVAPEDFTNPAVENVTRPLWAGDRLLLARRVVRGGETLVQGSWLDWPHIKAALLAETADLLPGADLAAVGPDEQPDPTRMLAGLPVRLVTPVLSTSQSLSSPLRWSLAASWVAIILALVAVAALLWGVIALSERRAAFVSSVTHELRTPLTTFRMYAEMLARDMVPSPERRREYLETLRTEAERLTHLVDNVLAYARLERGRTPQRAERTTAAAMVERFAPRLTERAAAASMTLDTAVDPAVADAALVTDTGVVEQIVFNLVDNAAKYAGRAEDRRIHLTATRDGACLCLSVRDHGPGFVSLRAAERAPAFSKSAEEAAETAPGVGLGLALCRRLARELGGRLDAEKGADGAGAAVTLRLPLGE